MGRSLSLVSVLVVSALSAGCTFSKASQSEIFKDGSAPLDLNLPDLTGTDSGGFMSDAHVTCVDANPQTMNIPPDILMVFDRSGSMNDDLNDDQVKARIRQLETYLAEVQTRGLNQLDRKILRSGLFNKFETPTEEPKDKK